MGRRGAAAFVLVLGLWCLHGAVTHAQPPAKPADKRAAILGFSGNTPAGLRRELANTAMASMRGVAVPTALEVLNCDGLRGRLEALGHDSILCDQGKLKADDLLESGFHYIITGEAMDVAGTVYLNVSVRNGQGQEVTSLALQADQAAIGREFGRQFADAAKAQLQKDNVATRSFVSGSTQPGPTAPPTPAKGGKPAPAPKTNLIPMAFLLTQQNPGENTFSWTTQDLLGARILQDVLLQYGHKAQPATLKATTADLKWLRENGNITEDISRASLAVSSGRSMWMRLQFKDTGLLSDPPVRMVQGEGRAGLFHVDGKRVFSYVTMQEPLQCGTGPTLDNCESEIRSRLVEPLVRKILGLEAP